MKKAESSTISRRAFVTSAALGTVALGLGGCNNSSSSSSDGGSAGGSSSGSATEESSDLTMLTASSNYKNFSEALTAAHPDVKLSMLSYAGYNTSDYIKAQMQAEKCPDIVINTFPNSDELQQNNLIDLSSKDFVNNVRTKLLDEVSVDGAIYLIPSNMSFFGPYYNKTLFEKQGWDVPTSLEELEALIPKIKKAGINVSEVTSTLPGSSFAFFFDILAPGFFSTLEGQDWMEKFPKGEAKATGTLEPYVKTLQRWIDAGLFDNVDPKIAEDTEAIERFKKGKTAFLVTVSNQAFTQNEDGSGDEYRIMPWLSDDGSNNIIITNVSRYYGLNKSLEDNEDKLNCGYELMEFLTTAEAQEALLVNSNTVSPLKNAAIEEDDPLHDAAAMVDEGKSMPMVYSGWEDYVAEMGSLVLEVIQGKASTDDLVAKIDDLQAKTLAEGGREVLATVEEDLNIEQVAQLVGTAYAKATDADCALISLGGFHDFGKENKYGCNGMLYAGVDVDINIVCSINPLGWAQLIKTGKLDGATIKKWVEEGFFTDIEGATEDADTEPFTYQLITKGGAELDDDTEYTVALVNETADRIKEGKVTDTELLGQDVLVDYFKELGVINSQVISWD